MRVAICEDSQTSLQYYEYLLTVASEKHELFIELSTFENGNELLFYLDGDGPPFDLIYLDVQMPKWDGVSVANELRNNMDYKGEIIFLTSHKESAVAGYEVHAYQYLLKNDTDRNRFEAVFLEVAKKIRQNKKQYLLLKGNGEF
ncbi:LytR/AlgR family response regulator transcription factor [Eubacterium aggregans]|uniref:LytR/AlgR family response regulator transcription factor n=1 Tax=Eubacterium aggregans TaxID=81409 RepID=UPI003F3AA56B